MSDADPFVIRRGGGHKALVTALVAIAAAAGLGGLSYLLWHDREAARADVQRLAAEKRTVADALEQSRAAGTEAAGNLQRCTEELGGEKTSAAEAEKKRDDLDAELTGCRSSVKGLEEEKKRTKAVLAELNGLKASFQTMIDSGKLEVSFRRGQMVVKLPAAVLFPSGSAVLSEEGKAALAEVATVLRKMHGRRFTIAGHTDNVPVVQAPFHDNWELSSARAVTVTELLVAKGVPGPSLVAAGFGEFYPISGNGTPAGRQRNRRIEILLEPDLKRVPVAKVQAVAKATPAAASAAVAAPAPRRPASPATPATPRN
jgi:chemotaxis protein MotB